MGLAAVEPGGVAKIGLGEQLKRGGIYPDSPSVRMSVGCCLFAAHGAE
jgi:hypothetical protein